MKFFLRFEGIFGPATVFCLAIAAAAAAEEEGFFVTISQSGEGERLESFKRKKKL